MTINYNVTGQDRKNLVKAIEELTQLKSKYLGAPSMAYQVGPYCISKTGELSFDEGTDAELLVETLCERGFDATVEIPNDAPSSQGDTYLAVSVPNKTLNQEARENLRAIIKAKGNLIKKALGADDLPILFGQGEISFPWFKEDATDVESHAYMQLISKLCDYAKDRTRVNSVERSVDNEKYAFRCFLLRLGFIGDEYKNDRKVLLKNFTGSSAFKSGHKREDELGMAVIPTPENTVVVDVEEAKRRLQDPAVQAEIRAIINGEDGDEE